MNRLSREALLIRCAYLFYQEKLNIKEVADRLDISRFKVSRYLKEAEDNNFVEIKLKFPDNQFEILAIELENKFNLKRVIIVPATPEMTSEVRRTIVGKKGTDVLKEIGNDKSIGITWGRTIAHMVESLPYDLINLNKITELTGGYGMFDPRMSTSSLAPLLAKKTHASCYQMHAPIISSNEIITKNLKRDDSIKRTFNMAKNSDIAIFGAANLSDKSMLYQAGTLTADDLSELKDNGVIGSIIGRFFDKDGNEVKTKFQKRSVSIEWEDFLKIPQRVALIGGANKSECLYGLVKGSIPTTLIIDDIAAVRLMEKIREEQEY